TTSPINAEFLAGSWLVGNGRRSIRLSIQSGFERRGQFRHQCPFYDVTVRPGSKRFSLIGAFRMGGHKHDPHCREILLHLAGDRDAAEKRQRYVEQQNVRMLRLGSLNRRFAIPDHSDYIVAGSEHLAQNLLGRRVIFRDHNTRTAQQSPRRGMRTSTIVLPPALLVTENSPSTSWARSFMLGIPKPLLNTAGTSNPGPASEIVRRSARPSLITLNDPGPDACFAMFRNASSAILYIVVAMLGGMFSGTPSHKKMNSWFCSHRNSSTAVSRAAQSPKSSRTDG